jgi:hypothetical protein
LKKVDFELPNISFHGLWKVIKIIMLIQVINIIIDYFIWVSYDYLISGWTIATLTVFFTVMILAIKVAQEREAGLQ